MDIILFVLLSVIISSYLMPLMFPLSKIFKVEAKSNNRTIHQGKMPQMAGTAIFISFVISLLLYKYKYQTSSVTISALLIGGSIIYIMGLIDDIFDLKPIIKLVFQVIAAVYVVMMGKIELGEINLLFFKIDVTSISLFVTIIWIVGVTNAINLIDGLDGLCAGISIIVLSVISYISYSMGKAELCNIAIILLGSIIGILPFNFHPAKMFLGDEGAQFLGFEIACLSILEFKASTFITLSFPIIVLFVPLADTFLAIIRRKSTGHKISEADKLHLHHVLMYKLNLGHKESVLALYLMTLLFGIDSILIYKYPLIGIIVLIALLLFCWIFIELTGMISPYFHPTIGLLRRITGYPRKSNYAFFEANKKNHIKEN